MRGAAAAFVATVLLLGCDATEPSPPATPMRTAGAESVDVRIAGEPFHMELAADPAARVRGLGGRDHVPGNSGMLFIFPDTAERGFVMRDCRVPIDIAFLDAGGRVVAIHAMRVEPARRPGESLGSYENRLPRYESGIPARYAVETAGGRLAELDLRVGDRVVFDRETLARRAR